MIEMIILFINKPFPSSPILFAVRIWLWHSVKSKEDFYGRSSFSNEHMINQGPQCPPHDGANCGKQINI